MDIILYNNSAEKIRVDKTEFLNGILTLTGTLRNACSIIKPSIIIDVKAKVKVWDDDSNNVIDDSSIYTVYDYMDKFLGCNYVHIPEFNRYYFVDNITSLNQNLWQIDLTVDTLMSFKDDIYSLSGIVSRNEFLFNKLLKDEKISYQYNKNIELIDVDDITTYHIEFGKNLAYDSYNAILCCLRNGATSGQPTPAYKNLPAVSQYETRYGSHTEYYCIPMIRCAGVMNDIFGNDTLKSYVKNIIILPFVIQGTPSTSHDIIIGDTKVDATGIPSNPIYLSNGSYNRFKYATITLPKADTYIDYEPFTEYELYVPYKGFVPISLSENAGNKITIFYNINFDSGQSTYILYNEDKELIIDNGSCELGYRLSLDSTNALEIQNQKNSLAISTTLSSLAAVISIAGGVATANPLAIAGGVMAGANAIGGAINKSMQMYNLGSTDIGSSVAGLLMYNKCYLKKTSDIKINDDGYSSLYGKPLYEYKKLSELKGYTLLEDIHIENVDNATSSEIDSIDTLLKTGIIL